MHTVFALLCFVVVIHWLIFPYPSGLLHWHCGNLTIVPVPAKQPWWIWINTSCEFIMNDCITTTKQSTTKPCAYFLGYTVNQDRDQGLDKWLHRDKIIGYNSNHSSMGLLPHTQHCVLRMHRECQEHCPRHRIQRKPLISDPDMHHGTCVTHVPWCMSGSLTSGGGEKVPGIPGACATRNLRIWQEAHATLQEPLN